MGSIFSLFNNCESERIDATNEVYLNIHEFEYSLLNTRVFRLFIPISAKKKENILVVMHFQYVYYFYDEQKYGKKKNVKRKAKM